ncbi:unnamed protein product [Rotaria magnacalcarata]|uniref:Uncharacterized protein n=1 Tax=Rotaria magnacalcarata TaxID=392030 RepID=A0A816EP32_9BILA|nr:unnamed protein product [Rotaria magnacalcarata]CAF5130262.1 unnamed protein product [Rotaria magnacalcarata]
MEDQYDYRLYIGYDYGDSWYDNASNWQDLSIFIKRESTQTGRSKTKLSFRAIILFGIDQRITAVWNTIASVALKDQCDYFYPANDDLELITKGWTSGAIHALKSCHVASNFGIATFRDVTVCMAPTFHLVHRTHLDFHNGFYYPIPAHGAAQDPWIYSLYRPWRCAFVLKQYQIRNHIGLTSGPRYDYADRSRLDQWIQRGRRELYGRLSTFNSSRYNQSFVNYSLLNLDLNWDTPC